MCLLFRAQTEWFSNSSIYTNKYKIRHQKYKNNRIKLIRWLVSTLQIRHPSYGSYLEAKTCICPRIVAVFAEKCPHSRNGQTLVFERTP